MSKRIVVVSTSNKEDYYFYAPFIEKAWNDLGWQLCVMITAQTNEADLKLNNPETVVIKMPVIEGLREETIAQASRLYAANYLPEDAVIMTSDMDLLPLQNYWNPKAEDITVYGHDLTDYTYYPMGYTAMTGAMWKQIFKLNGDTANELVRDAKEIGLAYSDDWGQWWNHDWQLLTTRIKQSGIPVRFVNRGRRAGSCFAYGRVDRGDSMQTPNETLIDAHCENHNVQHPDKLSKFINLFESVYGKI
jgi:hypothetical protein